MDITATTLLSAAGFVITTLVGVIWYAIKERIAHNKELQKQKDEQLKEIIDMRRKHEVDLAVAQEVANKEHLKQIEMRLGFGTERMTRLNDAQESFRVQLQEDRLALASALQDFQSSLRKLCENFVSVTTCKELRLTQNKEFEEMRKVIMQLAACQHESAIKLEGVSVHVKASSDSMKDLTTKLVDALELTAAK